VALHTPPPPPPRERVPRSSPGGGGGAARSLNNERKALEEAGQSGQTFHGMLRWVCAPITIPIPLPLPLLPSSPCSERGVLDLSRLFIFRPLILMSFASISLTPHGKEASNSELVSPWYSPSWLWPGGGAEDSELGASVMFLLFLANQFQNRNPWPQKIAPPDL